MADNMTLKVIGMVRKRMAELNFTEAQVAAQLGTTRQAVNHLLLGKGPEGRSLTLTTIGRYADVLKVPMSYLLSPVLGIDAHPDCMTRKGKAKTAAKKAAKAADKAAHPAAA